MFGITDPLTYLLGVVVIVLLPGPNSLFVLALAGRHGAKTAYRGAAGIVVGDAILMTASALGAASVLRAVPELFLVVKAVGAAYLAWLGIQLIRAAWQLWQNRSAPAISEESLEHVDATRPFQRALVISLLNPKAILFFVSFFVQFVDPTYPTPAITFLALGLVAQTVSILYLSALIFAGVKLAQAFRRRKTLAAVANAGVGALFMGFGAKLASASLT